MLISVQDTKKPNREPVKMSEQGLAMLKKRYGNRYTALDPPQKIIVSPGKIEVKQVKEVATPAKAKKG